MNFYHKRVLTFKIGNINVILRRIFGDIIGCAIGFNDYTIESVISNALGQGIIEANSVLIIVIVNMDIACGQGSGQLELELFVDRMVSAGTKTCFVAGTILIVVNLLLNRGLFNLRRNINVPVCLGNRQHEGIVGNIGIARFKVGSINDQIITCVVKVEGMVTYSGVCRICVCSRVEILADKTGESNAVIIGITPFADNRKNFLNSGSVGSVGSVDRLKLSANDRSILQFFQKIIRMSDVAAPRCIGNLIALNITLEDLESFERVVFIDVLLNVVCKRRDRHGAHHGNCQQCGQQLFDCFLHHDLRKSPFKFF